MEFPFDESCVSNLLTVAVTDALNANVYQTVDTQKWSQKVKTGRSLYRIIIWPRLKMTGNNQIQELDSGLDFPI